MSTFTIEQAIALADAHRKGGQLAEARDIYQRVLAVAPTSATAMFGLATVAMQAGHPESESLLRRAVELDPQSWQAWGNLGAVLQARKRPGEALACYEQSLARHASAEILSNAGVVLSELGRWEEARARLSAALALRDDLPEAHFNFGHILHEMGQIDAAMSAYHKAIALRPTYAEALSNLGSLYNAVGKPDVAIELYHRAIAAKPDAPEPYSNLGNAMQAKNILEETIPLYHKALALRPDYAEAHSNLGVTYTLMGRYEEAAAHYERAIASRPDFAKGHFHLAIASLMMGNFQRGWAEYEWRWRMADFPSPTRPFTEPQWTGGDIPPDCRTILLHGEQGLGDTIQFGRFVPAVVRRGWRVVLEVQPGLTRLFEMSGRGGADVLCERVTPDRGHLPAFDRHLPMASLPLVLGLPDPAGPDFPRHPYLRVSDDLNAQWRRRLEMSAPEAFRVGLVWAGSPSHKSDARRSASLASFAPLARCPATFISLQIGPAADQISDPPAGMNLVNLGPEITDFADTAAIINALDLLICVDTAVAHLAGALGRPCWLMLPSVADWRWMVDRPDTPWYSTLRLFRQTRRGDWNDLLSRVASELDTRIASQSSSALTKEVLA
jgi:tetratricopeptide (TPR) repeat protein